LLLGLARFFLHLFHEENGLGAEDDRYLLDDMRRSEGPISRGLDDIPVFTAESMRSA
jgi:hypothetical protein